MIWDNVTERDSTNKRQFYRVEDRANLLRLVKHIVKRRRRDVHTLLVIVNLTTEMTQQVFEKLGITHSMPIFWTSILVQSDEHARPLSII